MDLVIVESPTKARKLREYLGKNFHIEASVGHVRDLPKSKLGVDIENNFEPTYQVDEEKKKVISQLKKQAKTSKKVYLAMDPDREGEAIAWHVQHILNESKSSLEFLRATFHEITKDAVTKAIENPGEIRMDLVNAQQARRVVDRLVGYQISPVLWRKVRRGLSAGRVQSVALRLIVEREREIAAFKPDEYWEIDVLLNLKDQENHFPSATQKGDSEKLAWLDEIPDGHIIGRVVKVNGKKYLPVVETDVQPVAQLLEQASYSVEKLEKKERSRSSLPPFTTSTLQQTAATRLGFTSKQTMRLAQQLYEEGLITYHRTDSVNLSSQAVKKSRDFIKKKYGKQYLPGKPRVFKSKSKNAQEAHEAIRVTDLGVKSDNLKQVSGKFTPRHEKLYDLIWRRFVASQMSKAIYNSTTIFTKAEAKSSTAILKTVGSVLKFDGWMKLFPSGNDTILPDIKESQLLYFAAINNQQKFTQPSARYNDASLVKELEKRGIGRPSTYASIISVLETRGYVEREGRKFLATSVGETVNDFLMKYFDTIMDFDFTAEMEEDLDRISRGEKKWKKVVADFYKPLGKKIENVKEKAERMQVPVETTGIKCPKCGETDNGEVVIRTGRYGKFKSCGRYPDCDFTENIVEKVEGVKCPVCQEGDVIEKQNRWGRKFFGCSSYPNCDWAHWKAPEKGEAISPKEWEEIKKKRAERKKTRQKKSKGKGKTSK